MKCHFVGERYNRKENVLSTAKCLRYAFRFKPFQFIKGVRAMWAFLKASKNKGDICGRKEWETSEVDVRLWEKWSHFSSCLDLCSVVWTKLVCLWLGHINHYIEI